jgi:hypothetical protein
MGGLRCKGGSFVVSEAMCREGHQDTVFISFIVASATGITANGTDHQYNGTKTVSIVNGGQKITEV